MSERSCLVTGATGAVGAVLVEELLSQGCHVGALARHTAPSSLLPASVEAFTGDMCDTSVVARAVSGASLVFHLAAKLHIANPSPEMHAEYERVNVEGTRVLVEAARAAGVRRVVFFSTISVYGPTGGEPVDELTPTHPDTVYGDTKLRAEGIVLSARNAAGEPLGVVLRMAAIYGSRMKGNYVSLARALARGRFVVVGDGKNLRTLVYDQDAVRAAVLASRHPDAAGRIYNVTDGTVHSLMEIVSAICEAQERRPPRLRVPTTLARLAAGVVDGALSAGGRSRRFLPAVDKFVESVAVRGDRIQQELGFRPEYDLRRGWLYALANPRAELTHLADSMHR